MQGQLQLKYGAHNINTTIVGTSANYQVVQRVDIAYGRSFTNGDDAARVAAVSLIVGGIGIMNIMLVSVSERTREIGLRKAVGATRSDFLFQFLTEALMLCFAGGLVGVALGAGASVLLGRTFHWNMLISPQAIALSFGFSALVGAFFGLWPARGAAQLDPIESLRYE
jgi:putative ABC transport system permease protein